MAVSGLEIQLGPWMPNSSRAIRFTAPLPSNNWRHSTAMATEPPSSDGR